MRGSDCSASRIGASSPASVSLSASAEKVPGAVCNHVRHLYATPAFLCGTDLLRQAWAPLLVGVPYLYAWGDVY